MHPTHERYLEEAKRLARAHVEQDPNTQSVWFDETSAQHQEVRLVEVTTDVRETGAFFPFRFAANPARDQLLPISIVVMSPGDWQRRAKKKILAGWSSREKLRPLFEDGQWRE